MPMDKDSIADVVAVVMTIGEFGFAGFLLYHHGDFFPVYLAFAYFFREKHSAYHAVGKALDRMRQQHRIRRASVVRNRSHQPE